MYFPKSMLSQMYWYAKKIQKCKMKKNTWKKKKKKTTQIPQGWMAYFSLFR